jgi:hypothetical protein
MMKTQNVRPSFLVALATAVAAALLSGCAVEADPVTQDAACTDERFVYAFDDGAECRGTPSAQDAVRAGLAGWTQLGVSVQEVALEEVSSVSGVVICLAGGAVWNGQRAGSTTWQADGSAWIEIAGGLSEHHDRQVATHELGHVILHTAEHLPDDAYGVMAGELGRLTDTFTDADRTFFAERCFDEERR